MRRRRAVKKLREQKQFIQMRCTQYRIWYAARIIYFIIIIKKQFSVHTSARLYVIHDNIFEISHQLHATL